MSNYADQLHRNKFVKRIIGGGSYPSGEVVMPFINVSDWRTVLLTHEMLTSPGKSVIYYVDWLNTLTESSTVRQEFIFPTGVIGAPYNTTLRQQIRLPVLGRYLGVRAAVAQTSGGTQFIVDISTTIDLAMMDADLPVTAPHFDPPYLDSNGVLSIGPNSTTTLVANYLHVGDVDFFMNANYVAGDSLFVSIYEMGWDGGLSPRTQLVRELYNAGGVYVEPRYFRKAFRHAPAIVTFLNPHPTNTVSVLFSANPVP